MEATLLSKEFTWFWSNPGTYPRLLTGAHKTLYVHGTTWASDVGWPIDPWQWPDVITIVSSRTGREELFTALTLPFCGDEIGDGCATSKIYTNGKWNVIVHND